jgi:glucose dehydrogenase
MRSAKIAFASLVALFASFACLTLAPAQPGSPGPMPAPPASAAPAEDGQWTMPAKNHASTRYSGLAEITTENVKNLQVAFTFSTGVNRGQEAAPIVVGSTIRTSSMRSIWRSPARR